MERRVPRCTIAAALGAVAIAGVLAWQMPPERTTPNRKNSAGVAGAPKSDPAGVAGPAAGSSKMRSRRDRSWENSLQRFAEAFRPRHVRKPCYLRLYPGPSLSAQDARLARVAAAILAQANPPCAQRDQLGRRVEKEFLDGRDATISGWVGVVDRVVQDTDGAVLVELLLRPDIVASGGVYFCHCQRRETWRLSADAQIACAGGSNPRTEPMQYFVD